MSVAERTARRPLAVLALVLLTASGAAAQSYQQLADLDVEVAAEFPWPDRLGKGFEPVFVYLRSEESGPRPVTVQVGRQGWNFEHRTNREVLLGPGETVALELYVPAFESGWGGAHVSFESLGVENQISSGHSAAAGSDAKAVLVVGEDPLSETLLSVWSWRLSAREDSGSAGSTHIRVMGRTRVLSTGGRQVSTASLRYADLPKRFEPYTSLDLVIVDATAAVDAAALAPAFAAARLGAAIAVVGPEARHVARGVPALAAWMEPRFTLEATDQDGHGWWVYAMGHGRLVVSEGASLGAAPPAHILEALEDETLTAPETADRNDAELLRWFLDDHDGWVPNPEDPPGYFTTLDIPGMEELPYRAFVLILIAFFVVIGPLNFFFVKRSGKPGWLLVTIPGLAGLSALGILAYGFFVQGIDLRLGARTVTILDQREHRSDTLALRSFFAGLAPADGLHPGPTTACFPAVDASMDLDRLYLVDLTRNPVLGGEFLPVRREATQLVASERAARARVLWDPIADADAWEATNGLGANVRELYLRSGDGGWYGWTAGDGGASMADGERRRLEPLELAPVVVRGAASSWQHPWVEGPPPGAYVAVTDRNPFEDTMGLEPDQHAGFHVVVGVLEVSELEEGRGS